MRRLTALAAGALVAACAGEQPPGKLPTHAHECARYVDPLEGPVPNSAPRAAFEKYARFHACACSYDASETRQWDRKACGAFPCTKGGCYVALCTTDADCAAGVCSLHASWPHGYCVNDDPY